MYPWGIIVLHGGIYFRGFPLLTQVLLSEIILPGTVPEGLTHWEAPQCPTVLPNVLARHAAHQEAMSVKY